MNMAMMIILNNRVWRSLLSASLLAICVIVLLLPPASWAQHVHPAPRGAGPVIGAAAVPFELKTLDGSPAGLESYHGKPLILSFFASWCDPCREEMPLINEIAAKASGNYQVLGIAVEDSRAAVTDYVTEAKLVFPIALDLNSTVKRSYRIFGPPATFFIDGQGVIRDIALGPISADRIKAAFKKLGIAP
jgi:cytochrome c biogenesis protein CcmG/thiol:disulfide interchange protein DsbE